MFDLNKKFISLSVKDRLEIIIYIIFIWCIVYTILLYQLEINLVLNNWFM